MVATDLTNTTPSRSKDMTEYIDETEYTDEELALAIHAATYVRSGSISISHDISQASRQIHTSLLSDLRAILKHLPAQQGDWQECGFNDLRPTDKRVKAVFIGGSVIEGTPDQSSSESIFLVDGPVIHTYDEATFYRIPAPIVHPDPEEHPVIANVAVHKPGTNSTHRYDYATWDVGEYYDCWSNDGKYYGAWRPSAVVEWSPAKVVAGND